MIGIASRLSYARSLPTRSSGMAVRLLEWGNLSTPRLLWRMRHLAQGPLPHGPDLCDRALDALDITVTIDGLQHVPPSGPLVVVANHPSGILDGAALLHALFRVRDDVRIMARALAGDMPQIAPLILPVPYSHAANRSAALRDLNRATRVHLNDGGAVALFPAGRIATDEEAAWSSFALRLARDTGAPILPIRILDALSWLYRRAARIHPVLRQGVLLHEVLRRADRPMRLRIGPPKAADGLTAAALRTVVLNLPPS